MFLPPTSDDPEEGPVDTDGFAEAVIAWQRRAGRHQLPWQGTRDPYRVWLSEIMLQQTQVSTVIPYYQRFLQRFPTVSALAQAEEADVLAYWSGLGYYARGRNLHRAARIIRDEHGGEFPRELDAIVALPGVGRSTAGAICAFAFGQIHPILDGNVKRVLTRVFGVEGYPGERRVELQLWTLANRLLPTRDIEAYTQGVMDLGAQVCVRSRPLCDTCPLQSRCVARREHLVEALPTAKPRKPLPQRRTTLLLIWDGSQVLLERRPSPGIWGGLWCFPEVADDAQQAAFLARHALLPERCVKLRELKHGFTHYHLTIEPCLIEVAARSPSAAEAGSTEMCWMTPSAAREAALPAPVRTLLDVLDDAQGLLRS